MKAAEWYLFTFVIFIFQFYKENKTKTNCLFDFDYFFSSFSSLVSRYELGRYHYFRSIFFFSFPIFV